MVNDLIEQARDSVIGTDAAGRVVVDEAAWPKPRWSNVGLLSQEFPPFTKEAAPRAE